MTSMFPTWESFFKRFCKVGGVIEAVPMCAPGHVGKPSVSFLIEPDGKIGIKGSYDKFEAQKFVNAGCFFTQTNLPSISLVHLSNSVGEVLFKKGVIGYVTVDLVSFPDPQDPKAPP